MCDILVQHDTIQDLGVLNLSTRHLLNTSVSLGVNLDLSITNLSRNTADRGESEAAHELRPTGNELGADGGRDELAHGLVVVGVDRLGDLLDDLEGVGERALVGLDDDDRVDVALDVGKGVSEDLTGENDDRCSSVSNLLVLYGQLAMLPLARRRTLSYLCP